MRRSRFAPVLCAASLLPASAHLHARDSDLVECGVSSVGCQLETDCLTVALEPMCPDMADSGDGHAASTDAACWCGMSCFDGHVMREPSARKRAFLASKRPAGALGVSAPVTAGSSQVRPRFRPYSSSPRSR